jgi:hypothetical protein
MLGARDRPMSDSSSCTCSEIHTRAICDEVGERLRILLDQSQTPPPPQLLALLLKLQLSELKAATTIPARARAQTQASSAT